MNYPISHEDFEKLPYRDDAKHYVDGRLHRAKAWPRNVFVYRGPDYRPNWDCYQVDIVHTKSSG